MMKNFLLTLSLLFVSLISFGQLRTLNYQAVILDPKPIEIPGTNITGQPLKNGKVNVRFALLSSSGSVDYEENHETTTDEFGLINLTIGSGLVNASGIASNSNSITYRTFDSIKWDSNVKQLKVSLSFDSGKKYTTVSLQPFNYTAYAFYAESVEYKNVRDSPTTLSFFNNDVGFIVSKDLDPLKNQMDQNQKDNISKFLIINQSLSESDKKIADNSNEIAATKSKMGDMSITVTNQGNQINDQNNRINSNQEKVTGQINNLNSQIEKTDSKVQNLENSYENSGNKSNNIQSDQASTNRYPSVKAVKDYVDQATQGVALQATVNGKEDKTSKSTDIKNDKNPTTNYPTVEAVKSYVLESALGIDTKIIIDGKENVTNKSKDVVADGRSDDKYPTVAAIKKYVDESTIGKSIMATIEGKEDVKYKTNDITEDNANYYPTAKAVKKYVDNATINSLTKEVQKISINEAKTVISLKGGEDNSEITLPVVPSATSGVLGIVKLAGDLSGSADAPTIKTDAITTSKIAANAVDFSKIQNIGKQTVLGKGGESSGNVQALTLGTGLEIDANGVLNSTGGTLTGVSGATNRIKVVTTNQKAPEVDISENYVGQNSITTVGTITSGTWNGSTVGVANGGTGATTLTGIVKGNGTGALTAVNKIEVTEVNKGESTDNKSTTTALGVSDILYPTQNAVKTYVDNATKNALTAEVQTISINELKTVISLTGGTQTSTITLPVVPEAEATVLGIVKLAGDLQGVGSSASNPIISNLAVNTAKLAESAVTTAKINNGAVTSDKLDASAVTTDKINNLAVTAGKLAASAVETDKINAFAVTAGKLAENAVETEKINALAVTAGKLALNAVETDKINALAVTAGKLATGAVETDKINALAVTAGKLATGAVETEKINALAVTAGKLAANAVETDKINALAVTAGKIGTGAVETAKIAANAVEFSKIQNIASKTILGRSTAENGNVETLTLGTGLKIEEGVLKSSGGTVTEISGTTDRVTVTNGTSTPSIDISANYVGQSSITTVGTITSGTWSGSTVEVSKGGTGATSLTGYVKGNGTTALTAQSNIPVGDVTNGESILNKSTSFVEGNLTDIKYPSTKSVSEFVKGLVKDNTDDEHERNDEKYAHKEGDNEYGGKNLFKDDVTILKGKKLKLDTDATDDDDATNKKYVDGKVRDGFDNYKATDTKFGSIKLTNDLGGTAALPEVVKVGGSTALKVNQAEVAANAATALNTPSTIVKRDEAGKFNATEITSNLVGNVTGNLKGNVVGDVTGNVNNIALSKETIGFKIAGGATSKTLTVSEDATLSGSNTGDQTITLSGAVTGTGTGSFSTTLSDNVVTTSKISTEAVTSEKIANGAIVDEDIKSDAAIVDTKLAQIATSGKVANSATTATAINTASAIVARDENNNFAAGTITANLTGKVNEISVSKESNGFKISGGENSKILTVAADANISGTNTGDQSIDVDGDVTGVNTDGKIKLSLKKVPELLGGTNATTFQGAINNLTSASGKSGQYLRSDGVNASLTSIQAGDLPISLTTNGTSGASTYSSTTGVLNIPNYNLASLGGVAGNTDIVAGTNKTKISYDSKGLITAGADATTADIAESTGKKYVTEAQITKIADSELAANKSAATDLGGKDANDIKFPTQKAVKVYVDGKIEADEKRLDDHDSEIKGHKTKLDDHDGRISTAEGSISSQGGRLTSAEGSISSQGGRLSTAEGNIGTFSSTLSNHGNRLSTAESSIDSQGGRLSTAESSITSQGETLTDHDKKIKDQETRIGKAENKFGSDISTWDAILKEGNILIGNASNKAQARAVSGDITLDKNGVTALTDVLSSGTTTSTWGDATMIPKITLDRKGRVIAITEQAISGIGSEALNLSSGKIFVGSELNKAIAVDMSGDVTINNAGATVIGDSKITSSKIVDGTILAADLKDGEVTSAKLATDAVTSIKIASNAVTTEKIVADAVSSAKIADATIVNADIADATITDAKLATITAANKVSNSATSATATNTINTIVLRDGLGNFAAGTISAALTGNVTGDLTGNASTATSATTSTNLAGGTSGALAYQSTTGTTLFTGVGTAGQVLKSTGGSAPAWTTLSTADLSGTISLTSQVTGVLPGANGGTGVANTGKTITLGGNLTTTGDITTLSGSNTGDNAVNSLYSGLVSNATHTGDVTGSTELTIGDGKITSAKIFDGTIAATDLATDAVTSAKIVDGAVTSAKILDGSIAATDLATDAVTSVKILDATIVNADIATNAAIADSKLATITTSGKVANSATTATSDLTNSAIVARDASGNFTANTITGTLSGTASKATSLNGGLAGALAYQSAAGTTAFSGVGTTGQVLKSTGGSAPTWTTLSTADLSGTISLTSQVTGVLPGANGGTGVANSGKTITLGGNLTTTGIITTLSGSNTGDQTIVLQGAVTGSGTGTFTTTLSDNAVTSAKLATDAVTSAKIADATIVNADIANATITDAKLATISTALKVSNSATTATASNTASAIVARDGSNNFSAGTITASLTGNVTGNLTGNVTGNLTGTASKATNATNAGNLTGTTVGSVPYQSASGVTSYSDAGSEGDVLIRTSNGVVWGTQVFESLTLAKSGNGNNYTYTITFSDTILTGTKIQLSYKGVWQLATVVNAWAVTTSNSRTVLTQTGKDSGWGDDFDSTNQIIVVYYK